MIKIKNRLFKNIQKNKEGCWEWNAALFSSGYGMFSPYKGKTVRAHRYMWEFFYGVIPKGLCVLHKCDNRKCVNPKHLFLGTHKENMRDMAEKGRASKIGQPKLTRSEVQTIRKNYSKGKFSQNNLSELFGVSQSQISNIILGKKWV